MRSMKTDMIPTLSSLVAKEVIITTTSVATSHDKVTIRTTLDIQGSFTAKLWLGISLDVPIDVKNGWKPMCIFRNRW